ncbi:MAG: hemolysin family protein [bacterium]|nr:hemolysin family protein [bacterium]
MIVGPLILALLIALSAFFSGIESAFISLGEFDLYEIEKTRSKNRKLLALLVSKREKLLSTILVGNNLANIGASALATALAIDYGPELGYSPELSASIAAIFLTLVILIFGEVTPKSIAISHNRSIALFVSPVVYPLTILFLPATWLLSLASGLLSRLTGAPSSSQTISESTVITMVEKGEELGVINERERHLIENVFLFDDREVYPVMTPRTRVFALPEAKTLAEVKDQLLERMLTRIPVFGDSFDHITGILNLKDALRELIQGNQNTKLSALAQRPHFVYETQPLSSVLENFQHERLHLAVVVDEFGGMAGVITLEDILEELVGEIFDEKDTATAFVKPMGEHKWLVSGRHDIVTINRLIPGEIPIEGDFDSLQGMIMSRLDHVPALGDQVHEGPHKFTVIKMNKNEILSVLIEYLPQLDQSRLEDQD